MGLLDKFRRGEDKDSLDIEAPPTVVLDTTTRTRQLLVLADALEELAGAMGRNDAQRYNPGWSGRMGEYADAAERARTLRRDGFDLEQLLDLAAEVRPLFVRGQAVPPDPAMLELEPQQDAVMSAVRDLRAPLVSERPEQ